MKMVGTNVLKFKKVTSVFMAMLLMILSFSYTANDNSNAVNSSKTYNVYNANGNFLRSYSLAPLETNYNARKVIGDDERVIDWTKSGVVKIIISTYSFGSGFIVDKHTIATAAHCLYDYDLKMFEGVTKILLFDADGNVIKYKDDKGIEKDSITPVEYHLPKEFITNNQNRKESDYALITVEEDLSKYMCFDLGIPLDAFVNGETNATVSVTGFPGYLNNDESHLVNTHNKHMMYTGNGKICSGSNNKFIYYEADTSGGNSGGPVYITESLNGKTYYTVVAIHTTGANYNYGTRIDTNLIHFYKSNDNIEW